MRHAKAEEWEATLKKVFDRIDADLENEYGKDYPLHPVRPPHGITSNREDDGLFDIGAAFSAGYGSKHGPGYVVKIRMATLADVPPEILKNIERRVMDELRKILPHAFPGRNLKVELDGHVFKIIGDLGLNDRQA